MNEINEFIQHNDFLQQLVAQISLLEIVVKGIIIGIVASAPMGPVGVLCVQRTLNKGRIYGFVTGCGAAVSDIFYALITGYGLSFIYDFINNQRNLFWLQHQPCAKHTQRKPQPQQPYTQWSNRIFHNPLQPIDYISVPCHVHPNVVHVTRPAFLSAGNRLLINLWWCSTMVAVHHIRSEQTEKPLRCTWYMDNKPHHRCSCHNSIIHKRNIDYHRNIFTPLRSCINF